MFIICMLLTFCWTNKIKRNIQTYILINKMKHTLYIIFNETESYIYVLNCLKKFKFMVNLNMIKHNFCQNMSSSILHIFAQNVTEFYLVSYGEYSNEIQQ